MSVTSDSTTKPQKYFALAILAHPDDESFVLGGTTLKFAAEGKRVGIICATRGEKGADRLNRRLSEQQIAEIRAGELEHACDLLSCSCAKFLSYPDGGLDQINFGQLTADLTGLIDYYQPEIILTFGKEGVSGHKDHIVIGQAATAASQKAAHKVKEIWLASIPSSAIQEFNEHLAERKVHHNHFQREELQGVPDDQLLKIDIKKYASQKHAALKAHESQYLPQFAIDAFMNFECFEVIKL